MKFRILSSLLVIAAIVAALFLTGEVSNSSEGSSTQTQNDGIKL